MKLLDTNILLRWILEDDKKKADAFAVLLKEASKGKETLYISDMTIAEIVWVLESNYDFPNQAISQTVRNLLSSQSLQFENQERLFDAIAIYEDHNIDFIDAYLSAVVKEKKVKGIFSYDRDFDRVPGIRRIEPYSCFKKWRMSS